MTFKTIYDHLTAEDLMYALFEQGGDPEIIETEEEAQQVADLINDAEQRGEIEDDRDSDGYFGQGEFSTAMRQLDMTEDDNPEHIYFFCNGNAGKVCFQHDYE